MLVAQLRRDIHLQRIGLDQGRLTPPFRIRAFVHEFDRHRPDQVLAGVRRLELVVEPARVPRTRLGGPLAVVANEKVAHGLSERRRLDLDAGLGLDRTSISTRSDSRGSRGETRTKSFTGPFSALRSIALPDADGDAPSLLRHPSAAGEQGHATERGKPAPLRPHARAQPGEMRWILACSLDDHRCRSRMRKNFCRLIA